jgi:agmatinase
MSLYYAHSRLSDARTVVLGIPYDRTSSFVPGSRFGPGNIRQAADNIESYSPYQQRDLEELAIHDAGDVRFDDMTWPGVSAQIRKNLAGIFARNQIPICLGGEHSITPPIVAACAERWPGLVVLQFDAHADLRSEFLNESHSHATAMHHVGRIVGRGNVYQFGIRSGTRDEFDLGEHLYPFSVLEPLRKTRSSFQHNPIYLSIDIDVLDPGVMPAVSTPEPGGIDYRELIAALQLLRGFRIVGADIVEYNPLANRDPAGASLVAALLRELILMVNPVSDLTTGHPGVVSNSTKEPSARDSEAPKTLRLKTKKKKPTRDV